MGGLSEFLSKWIVIICAICDGAIIGFGMILGIVAIYYKYTLGGGEGPTTAFVLLALLFIAIGIVGAVALWRHYWWLLLASNGATVFVFICLFALTVISFIIGFGITDAVKEGVQEGWSEGRKEYESGGLCKDLDGCTAYYPKITEKMGEWDAVANPNKHMQKCQAWTEFDLATNCTYAKDCDYSLGTDPNYGCQKCDAACQDQAVADARDTMKPLSISSIIIFCFLTVIAIYNDFLMERANFGVGGGFDDGEKDMLEWIGFGANAGIVLLSLILMILGALAPSSSSTGLVILFLGLLLGGASAVVAVGLFLQSKLTGILVFAGNVAMSCLALILLMVAIVAGLSAGIVTNVNEDVDTNWNEIRAELSRSNPNYCAYMDDDQCKAKIRLAIETNFMHVATVSFFILVFLVGKIYLTHRTMKFFFKFDKDEHAEMSQSLA